jgi:peptidoglycan/xylan/chitin deacetylase (PgdA/CDA1 family)
MSLKQAVLRLAPYTGLATSARRATRRHLRILCYHGLWVTPGLQFGDRTFMAVEDFEARMTALKQSGHPVLPLGDAVDRLAEGRLPDAAVAITIDDGWASTHSHMLPVLERLGLPATLYATTWYAGRDLPVVNVAVRYLYACAGRPEGDARPAWTEIEQLPVEERLSALRTLGSRLGVDESWLDLRQFHLMTPDELREAHRRGLDVQLHTHRHIDVAKHVDALPEEIEDNRESLRRALGDVPLHHFCFPGGRHHPRAPALLAAAGVRSATLVRHGLNPPGTSPYALRRFLDGRSVTAAEFRAYLSGTSHWISQLGNLLGKESAWN